MLAILGLLVSVTVAPARDPVRFVQISAGEGHTCGLNHCGEAFCWGVATDGQLGNGESGPGAQARGLPVPVSGGLTFSSIEAGDVHTCAVTPEGAAYCWGDNSAGALGDGTATLRSVPTAVSGGLAFRQVEGAGGIYQHTCGATTGDEVYCWGENRFGQLGDGGVTNRTVPVLVGTGYVRADAGRDHSCGLTTDQRVDCWGRNHMGQLGNGDYTGPESCDGGTSSCSRTPVPVTGGLTFDYVESGAEFSCGIDANGDTYCWGSNVSANLGMGSTTGPQTCTVGNDCAMAPQQVVGGLAFASLSVGAVNACGVTADGSGYCWGANTQGNLGIGTSSGPQTCYGRPCASSPQLVGGGYTWSRIDAGTGSQSASDGHHSCGVTTGERAYCWGYNGDTLALGDGTNAFSRTSPTPVANTAGGFNTVAVNPIDTASCDAPATLTFDQTTEPGLTVLTSGDTGPAPPPGFSHGEPALYYDLSTTATYPATIETCIDYTGRSFVDEGSIGLFEDVSGTWVERTTTVNTTTNVACGSSATLSVYALFEPTPPDAGRTPDGNDVPGTVLTLEKAGGEDITLAWGDSCLASDDDYAVYEGPLGDFDGHVSRFCSTGGATTVTFTPDAGARYYLIVPRNASTEGSYGVDSAGDPRATAAAPCLPQRTGACA